MNKSLLFLLSFLISYPIFSKTIFLSLDGDDQNTGLSEAQAWRSIDRLNASNLQAGDQVRFRRGDTFIGHINLNGSGKSGQLIQIGAYGTGAKPIISGIISTNTWFQEGANLWACSMPQTVKYLFSQGKRWTLARYPNEGYVSATGTSRTHAESSQIARAQDHWKDGLAHVRSSSWTWDIKTISSSTASGRINFSSLSESFFSKGYGFFIDNLFSELDTEGEWFYDSEKQKLYVFTAQDPNTLNFQASVYRHGIASSNTRKYIHIQDLHFYGQYKHGIQLADNAYGNSHIEVSNCTFDRQGLAGINIRGTNHKLHHNEIKNTLGAGVFSDFIKQSEIGHNHIHNIATLPGLGGSGLFWGAGVFVVNANNLTISHNDIDSTGYNGISFYTSNSRIENNVIRHSLLTLKDGGGIYTWGDKVFNTVVRNNIVSHAIGYAGATPNTNSTEAHGIYIDNYSYNIEISNNTVSYCADAGILINAGAHDNLIKENIAFANRLNYYVNEFIAPKQTINNLLQNNQLISLHKNSFPVTLNSSYDDERHLGNAEDNYFYFPEGGSALWHGNVFGYNHKIGFEEWERKFPGTNRNPIMIDAAHPDLISLHENPHAEAKILALTGTYSDVTGKLYNDPQLQIPPFSSIVMIKIGDLPIANEEKSVHRINAGGLQYIAGVDTFLSDKYSHGNTWVLTHAVSIEKTTYDDLYKTQLAGKDFDYRFPVPNGTYTVRLHFVENGDIGLGERIFSINIESGKVTVENVDILAEAARNEALQKQFENILVEDGELHIQFSASIKNATVAAIEVFPFEEPQFENTPPSFALSADLKLNQDFEGIHGIQVVPDPVPDQEKDQGVIYSIEPQLSQIANMDFDPLTGSVEFSSIMGQAGVETFTITADDGQENNHTFSEKFTLEIQASIAPPIFGGAPSQVRINCGSTVDMSFGGFIFSADRDYSSTSKTNANPNLGNVGNTRFDDLYRTERFAQDLGGSFSYNIPISNGRYVLILHFAEIYLQENDLGAIGARVFDVEVEGSMQINQQDVFRESGAGNALAKLLLVDVSDGSLDLNLYSKAGQAQIGGIEVLPLNQLDQSIVFKDGFNKETLEPELKALLHEDLSTLTVFPNPASDHVKVLIEGEVQGNFEIEVFDGRGTRVLYQRITKDELSIKAIFSTSQLPAGTYFVRVQNGQKMFGKRLLVR